MFHQSIMSLRRPGVVDQSNGCSPEDILKKINGARGRSLINFELQKYQRRPGGLNYSGSISPGPLSPESPDSDRQRNPSETSVTSIEGGCSCNRRQSFIQCKECGHIFKGRVRLVCEEHPHTIHLMDSYACPNCKRESLIEFVEVETR